MESGFFLRKKPLCRMNPVNTRSENAVVCEHMQMDQVWPRGLDTESWLGNREFAFSMNRTHVAENQVSLKRLFDLTAQLTDEMLAKKMPNGWTVANTLVHLAFWDAYGLSALQEWEKSGFNVSTSFQESTSKVNAINEGVRVVSNSISAHAVVPLVCSTAAAVDQEVERITPEVIAAIEAGKFAPELVAAIEAGGEPWFLNRAQHRNAHLSKIEKELEL